MVPLPAALAPVVVDGRARVPEAVVGFGTGELRYSASKTELYALCKHPLHRDGRCLRARNAKASARLTLAGRGHVRPLGMLAAWLLHECEERVYHKAYNPSHTERLLARVALRDRLASMALVEQERPRRDGEDSEPDAI